jgi:hypothetical protein
MFIQMNVSKQYFTFYLMPTRFWELSIGAILFLIERHALNSSFTVVPILKLNTPLVIGLCLALIFSGPFSFYSLVSVACLTALIIMSSHLTSFGYRVLTLPAVIWSGRISYSLYLWHWSVLVISKWTIGISWWLMPLQLMLIFLLASWSYHYLEKPLRYRVWSVSSQRTIAYATSAALSVAIGLGFLAGPIHTNLFAGGTLPQMEAVGPSSLIDQYGLRDGSMWKGDKCVLSDNQDVGKAIHIADCTLGDFSTAKRRVLVLGNSFSAAFVRAFDDLVLLDGYAVTITSLWDASVVQEIPNKGWDKANDYYWTEVVPSLVANLRKEDWVFLVNDMAQFSAKTDPAEVDNQLRLLESGLQHFSDKLKREGLRLAVLHGNPFAREANCFPAQALTQWFDPFHHQCHFLSKEETLKRRSKLDSVLVALQNKGNIRLVDLFEIFCHNRICTYEANNGQMLYRDERSHPSVEAARLSAPIIREALIASNERYFSGYADANFQARPITTKGVSKN